MKKILVFLALTALLLSGCTPNETQILPSGETPTQGTQGSQSASNVPAATPGTPVHLEFEKTDGDMFTQEDFQTEPNGRVFTVTCNGSGVNTDTNSVRTANGVVTVTGAASFAFSGELDGMLVVDAGKNDTVHLIFNGVNIHNETGAALYIRKAKKVIVTLAEGTQNRLSNGGSFQTVDESNIDGAVFSKKDLTFNGSGELEVRSPVGHGIVCKDNLVLTGGSIAVTAAEHGLDANDSIRIAGGSLTIDAGRDGIHGETADDTTLGFVYLSGGAVKVEAEGDGISAGAWLQLQDGEYNLFCGGGYENGTKANSGGYGDFMGGGPGGMGGGRTSDSTQLDTESTSMKGIKAVTGLVVNGGKVTIDAADDALHSDLSLIINGGDFTVASGDDAVHAEETLTITDCNMLVSTCYEGLEAHEIYVTGGTVSLVSSDDGINAAGGNDASGGGGRDQMFGGGPGGPGGPGGMGGNSTGVVSISGGNLYLNASGDGIDANGSLTITGGYTVVCGPTQGDTAVLDYDNTAIINGGTFIGTGSVMMAQTLTSDSGQGVVAVYSRSGFPAGTKLTLTDGTGKTLISHTPELNFQLVILTTPEMKAGTDYTLSAGETSATVTAN